MRSLEIDLRFDGGDVRIKRATGFAERRNVRDVEAMLALLWKQPAHRQLVLDVARGKRLLTDLYVAFLSDRLDEVGPTAGTDHDVAAMLDPWLLDLQVSDKHKGGLRQAFKSLLAVSRRSVHLSELAETLETYRSACVRAGTPRAFNLAKMACLALLRDTVGKRSPLRTAIADVPGMPERKSGVKGMTLEAARVVRKKLLDAGEREAAATWWGMCLTGMGPTEFWGEWSLTADRVIIKGTKRPGRRWGSEGRQVPLLVTLEHPTMTMDHFGKLLHVAGASPYQGRKTFTRLMEFAKIPRTRRILYLGHGVKDVTFLYEEYEVTEFLAEDRERLLKALGPEPTLALVKTHGLVVGQMAQEA